MPLEQDATPTGVSPEGNDSLPGGEAPKDPPINPRLLAMDAMSDSHDQERGVEPDQLAAQLAPEPTEKPANIFAKEDTLVTVKVDGVESQVTVAEMQRAYQKGLAADKRFEEGARARADAERLLAEAQKIASAPQPVAETPKPVQNGAQDASGAELQDTVRATVKAMFEGDEDAAVDRLVALVSQRRTENPTLDIAQLTAQLTPQIRQQMEDESALDAFAVNNKFIVDDPYLAQMADQHFDAAKKTGKSFSESLETAATAMRDWAKSKGMKIADEAPTTDRQTKLDRKARIDNVRGLGTKAATPEVVEPTATDVIKEMRLARGLPA